jgi:hypothetical protein
VAQANLAQLRLDELAQHKQLRLCLVVASAMSTGEEQHGV